MKLTLTTVPGTNRSFVRNLFIFAFFPLVFSCNSGPVVVPEDMAPTKIIQNAQEATDINRYKIAVQYYQVLRERYDNVNEYLAVAEYEIAFIRYKQKKYAEARQGFEVLLARYKEEGANFPPQFKILAEKMLDRLTTLGQ